MVRYAEIPCSFWEAWSFSRELELLLQAGLGWDMGRTWLSTQFSIPWKRIGVIRIMCER